MTSFKGIAILNSEVKGNTTKHITTHRDIMRLTNKYKDAIQTVVGMVQIDTGMNYTQADDVITEAIDRAFTEGLINEYAWVNLQVEQITEALGLELR